MFFFPIFYVPSLAFLTTATTYPPTHVTGLGLHDPSVLKYQDHYYAFYGGDHISISRARSLDGPWSDFGTVLSRDALEPAGNET